MEVSARNPSRSTRTARRTSTSIRQNLVSEAVVVTSPHPLPAPLFAAADDVFPDVHGVSA